MPAHEYVNKGQFPESTYRDNLLFRAVTLNEPEITERIHSGNITAQEVLKHLGSDTGVGMHWTGTSPHSLYSSRMHGATSHAPATVVMVAHHNDQMTDNTWSGQYEGQGATLGEYHPTLPTQVTMHSMMVDTGDPTKPMQWDSDPHWRHLPGSAGLRVETFYDRHKQRS